MLFCFRTDGKIRALWRDFFPFRGCTLRFVEEEVKLYSPYRVDLFRWTKGRRRCWRVAIYCKLFIDHTEMRLKILMKTE